MWKCHIKYTEITSPDISDYTLKHTDCILEEINSQGPEIRTQGVGSDWGKRGGEATRYRERKGQTDKRRAVTICMYIYKSADVCKGDCESEKPLSCVRLCDSMDCSPPGFSVHGILQAKILEWADSLLQGIFPTQGLNPGLPHCRWILYCLSLQGVPRILEWVAYPFSSRYSWPGFFTSWATREAHKGHFSPLKTSLKVSLVLCGMDARVMISKIFINV